MAEEVAKKTRDANSELLRLTSMLMIVGLHFFYNCAIARPQLEGSNFAFTWAMEGLFYVAVDCFILISGYYGLSSKINWKRIASICLAVWFYSYLFLAIAFVVEPESLDLRSVMFSLFPIISGHYWFVTAYLLLTLLSPLLNQLVIQSSERPFSIGLGLALLGFSIIPTLYPFADSNLGVNGGTGFTWVVVVYLAGGWLRRFGLQLKRATLFALFSVCIVIVFATKMFLSYNILGPDGGAVFYHHNSILVFVAAVCLFSLFRTIEIANLRVKRGVLLLSSLSLGIYVIHENLLLKALLWSYVRELQDLNSAAWPVFAISSIALIYIACALVEFLRSRLFRLMRVDVATNAVVERLASMLARILQVQS